MLGVAQELVEVHLRQGTMTPRTVSQFAWGLLAFCLTVLVFGAFVRASFSGDGCGAYWPTCGEGLIPTLDSKPKAVEFTHRAMGALQVLGCVLLFVLSRKVFGKVSPVTKAALIALGTAVVSAIIGAILVLAQWVTTDKSAGRAVTMPIHLVNNYILVASLVCAGYWAGGGKYRALRHQKQMASSFAWAFGSLFVLGATGAFSAMGKTAFQHELAPLKTFAERMWLHVGPEANPILRGGVIHPLIATSVGLLLFYVCASISKHRPSPEVKNWAKWTMGTYAGQMVLGLVNLFLSAPIPMQLSHLALAIANFTFLVLMGVTALGVDEAVEEARPLEEAKVEENELVGVARQDENFGRATWRDYVALTKPRVISLLLFTTVLAMFVAHHGAPPLWLILCVCIGGYAAAGAANTFNMVAERDLDNAMERTSHRPTVTNKVSKRSALQFAWALSVGSFAFLWLSANFLSATLALCGLLCYVFVYTLWLKRRTWHNIVIGGAAGAFPPLVGYAAVTGGLSPMAWFLFALVFLWTPVHFWALAILIKDDYAKAGVPMLPVVKGDRVTVNQIGLYTILTSLVCVLPFFQSGAGPIYLVGSTALNLGLIVQTARLWRTVDRPHAKALFKYSMVYLALFFIVVALDQARYV